MWSGLGAFCMLLKDLAAQINLEITNESLSSENSTLVQGKNPTQTSKPSSHSLLRSLFLPSLRGSSAISEIVCSGYFPT